MIHRLVHHHVMVVMPHHVVMRHGVVMHFHHGATRIGRST
jgi:hypothetical protein